MLFESCSGRTSSIAGRVYSGRGGSGGFTTTSLWKTEGLFLECSSTSSCYDKCLVYSNEDEGNRIDGIEKLTCNFITSCLRVLFSVLALRSSLSLDFSKESLGSSLTGIIANGATWTSFSLPRAESFATGQ